MTEAVARSRVWLVGLPVPFDCQLDALKIETEKAVWALAKELETATMQGP
jgi:hypothetical protein